MRRIAATGSPVQPVADLPLPSVPARGVSENCTDTALHNG